MNKPINLRLVAADIEKLSSHYLNEGRKQESWKIGDIEIHDTRLTATVSMRSFYVSESDAKGFHLTIFSTLEFLSQLMIIYGHAWAGLSQKAQEGWMVESSVRNVKAIRDPAKINVDMNITVRKLGEKLYGVADYRVTDDLGGLFEGRLKGFLS